MNGDGFGKLKTLALMFSVASCIASVNDSGRSEDLATVHLSQSLSLKNER